jgi:hypothetical protein
MKEISLSKNYCNKCLFSYGCLFCFCSSFAVCCLYFVVRTLTNYTNDNIFVEICCLIMYPFFAKLFLEKIITFLRFYNLRIEILRDKLVLRTDTKECEIPMTEDTTVVCCMDGWLIVWPSKKSDGIILLPKVLLLDDFLELCFYFQENTHYIPSQSIIQSTRFGNPLKPYSLDYYQPNADYAAAYKEEKKLLKSLKINTWTPLKYIKWPA